MHRFVSHFVDQGIKNNTCDIARCTGTQDAGMEENKTPP